MSKKRIGIPGWSLGDNSFGVTKSYLDFFSKYGQVEIITPRKDTVELDLLILPGGQDLSTIYYDQVPGYFNSNPDQYKEYFFRKNLELYIKKGTAIFGICLGHQMLNVFFGGSLTQHLPYHETSTKHRGELVHKVAPVEDYNPETSEYCKITAKAGIEEVNSLHHQGFTVGQLGKGLIPLYVAHNAGEDEKDELVEVMVHEKYPIASCQFHPEELEFEPITDSLLKNLLNVEENVEV